MNTLELMQNKGGQGYTEACMIQNLFSWHNLQQMQLLFQNKELVIIKNLDKHIKVMVHKVNCYQLLMVYSHLRSNLW